MRVWCDSAFVHLRLSPQSLRSASHTTFPRLFSHLNTWIEGLFQPHQRCSPLWIKTQQKNEQAEIISDRNFVCDWHVESAALAVSVPVLMVICICAGCVSYPVMNICPPSCSFSWSHVSFKGGGGYEFIPSEMNTEQKHSCSDGWDPEVLILPACTVVSSVTSEFWGRLHFLCEN